MQTKSIPLCFLNRRMNDNYFLKDILNDYPQNLSRYREQPNSISCIYCLKGIFILAQWQRLGLTIRKLYQRPVRAA